MLSMILAMAAQASSTNCYPVGNTVQCNTYGQVQPAPQAQGQPFNSMEALNAFQMGRQARQQEQAYETPEPPPTQEQADRAAAQAIFAHVLAGRMNFHINHGRCRESFLLATYAEEYAMAARSREVCPF